MNSPGEWSSDPGLGRSAIARVADEFEEAETLPDLRVEHTPGRCQPVTLYVNGENGSALAKLLRSRVATRHAGRVRTADVTLRFVPAFAGYEPWTADPLDPFAGTAGEITIGIPPERVDSIASACEGSSGPHAWAWFPELKVVRY